MMIHPHVGADIVTGKAQKSLVEPVQNPYEAFAASTATLVKFRLVGALLPT
jgi:hypothetical protein